MKQTFLFRVCASAKRLKPSSIYQSLYLGMRMDTLKIFTTTSAVETVCSAAVKTTIDSNCPLIIVLTETGHTAVSIAKYRPKAPIMAISASERSIRQLPCVRGVTSIVTASFVGTDSVITKAIDQAKTMGMVKSGDWVVAVHGEIMEYTSGMAPACAIADACACTTAVAAQSAAARQSTGATPSAGLGKVVPAAEGKF